MLLAASVSIGNGQTVTSQTSNVVVPRLVNFSGHAADENGKLLSGITGVTFAIYREQLGGAALWVETQNVNADAKGNFTAQLGATKPDGLPLELFTSGEARWLGVSVNGGAEQARILLMSVPYALKAADAQTLNGLPASAFVLAAAPNGSGSSSIAGNASSPSSTPPPPASAVTTNGGIANTLPLFSTGTDIENSAISQTGSGATAKIGIGTTAPVTTLDVKGGATIRGVLNLPATGVASSTVGKNSQAESFVASAFNSSTSAAVNQTFQWKAEPANNNTANPSGVLSFLYGSGTTTPADTGLRIGPKGIIGFASGQTFPGAGGVSSVAFSAPSSDFTVTGSPITSSGTLGLNWTVAPTSANTANAIVKRDANGNFSAGDIFAVDTQGNVGLSGYSPTNYGVAGQSGTSAGVYGTSSNANGLGVWGWAQISGDGVDGTSASGRGIYGSVKQGQGVMGESYGTTAVGGIAPAGVVGLAHDHTGYGVYAQNYDPNGVGLIAQGGTAGIFAYGNGEAIGGAALAADGTGVRGSGDWAFSAAGNAHQDNGSFGWPKAMLVVNAFQAPYNITNCFNPNLHGAAATTPPCGFTLTEFQAGVFGIDVGFSVTNSFFSTSVRNFSLINGQTWLQTYPGYAPNTMVIVYLYNGNSNPSNATFDLIVY